MTMDLRLIDYVIYIVASVLLTVWVGDTLYRNGRPFLVSVFKEDGLADSVNRLLVVGNPERRPRPLPGTWLRGDHHARDCRCGRRLARRLVPLLSLQGAPRPGVLPPHPRAAPGRDCAAARPREGPGVAPAWHGPCGRHHVRAVPRSRGFDLQHRRESIQPAQPVRRRGQAAAGRGRRPVRRGRQRFGRPNPGGHRRDAAIDALALPDGDPLLLDL